MTDERAVEILKSAIKKPNTKDGYLGQAIDMGIRSIEALNKLDSIIVEQIYKSDDQKECMTFRWVLDKIAEVRG